MEKSKLNEMMDRPVINKDVRNYLRENLKPLSGELHNIQMDANAKRVPIIPHETVVFFKWFLGQVQPQKILEIGTAIGFSSALFAESISKEGSVYTIERNPDMIEKANYNLEKLNLKEKVKILEGQAEEWLDRLQGEKFDFIFMDSAKAKYFPFFPKCMRVLKMGGVLAIDDVLQGGTILEDDQDIPRRRRKIHRMLNKLLEVVLDHPALETSLIPVGDGLLLITKKEDYDFSFMEENL